MEKKKSGDKSRGKGQSLRLEKQHESAGGPLGIFGELAQKHDKALGEVMKVVLAELVEKNQNLSFRHRMKITKREINQKLKRIDASLGQVLFVQNAAIKPDGGVIEVMDINGNYRVVLVSESKHQGNDVEKIRAGIKQGKNKDADFMVAGNAIERVHKNIQEFRNLMLDESHFPYVVFLQGSNFATSTFVVNTPEGRNVLVRHDIGSLNRIDRVTASSFGMEINQNYCQNRLVEIDGNLQMLQAASLYFQSDQWSAEAMRSILLDVARTSLNLLANELPN